MSNPPVPDSDCIPSTAQVRRSYDGQWDVTSPHGPNAAAEFDRWLAAHERATQAALLNLIDDNELNTDQAREGLGIVKRHEVLS